jgi:hypothetical protein
MGLEGGIGDMVLLLLNRSFMIKGPSLQAVWGCRLRRP